MPPYGAQFQDFFRNSESDDFKTLGDRVKIVDSTGDGLKQTISHEYVFFFTIAANTKVFMVLYTVYKHMMVLVIYENYVH